MIPEPDRRRVVAPSHGSHIAGIAALGGIGFTVSLFISGLAFDDPRLADAAELAVLVASTAPAFAGAVVLRKASHQHPAVGCAGVTFGLTPRRVTL